MNQPYRCRVQDDNLGGTLYRRAISFSRSSGKPSRVAGGATSKRTATSTSLRAPAVPRATLPNRYAATIPPGCAAKSSRSSRSMAAVGMPSLYERQSVEPLNLPCSVLGHTTASADASSPDAKGPVRRSILQRHDQPYPDGIPVRNADRRAEQRQNAVGHGRAQPQIPAWCARSRPRRDRRISPRPRLGSSCHDSR